MLTGFVVSVTAGEAAPGPSRFQQAYEAGRRHYFPPTSVPGVPRSAYIRPALSFVAARTEFRKALELAQSDNERAAARLAIGDSLLRDLGEADPSTARAEFSQVLALKNALAEQKAEAHVGMGETYLREDAYARARKEFANARAASANAAWAAQAQFALTRSYVQQRKPATAKKELARLLEMETLNRETARAHRLKGQVQSLLDAVTLAPRVRRDRPRLFFNTQTWPAVKARALGVEREHFDKLRAEVEEISLATIRQGADASRPRRAGPHSLPKPPPDWGMALMKAAFVYRVTGDAEVLEKVRTMLPAAIDFYLTREEDWVQGYSRVGCAAALDWVWDDLPSQERETLAAKLLRYVYTLHVEDEAQGRLSTNPFYYERHVLWYAGVVLLHDGLDDVAWLRVLSVLGQGYRFNKGDLDRHLRLAGDDGAWHLNLAYSMARLPTITWAFMHTWESAIGEPVPREWLNLGLPVEYALRNILSIDSGWVGQFEYSRAWGSGKVRADLLYDHLGHCMHFFGQSHPGHVAIAHWLRQRLEQQGCAAVGEYPVFPFLMTELEKAPPPAIPDNLPLARHFENIGLVLMSSGFGPDDTRALFAVGGGGRDRHMAGSENFDTAHFSLFKKGHLAVDSGTHGGPTPPEPEHRDNYWCQTVAHNCVLIHMPGETFKERGGRVIESNSGGQRQRGTAANVLTFETDGEFCYAATDATATYHPDKCAQMVRQFFFFPPDYFVVFDRVTAAKAEFPKTWLFHTANEPALDRSEFRADQAQGRVFVRTLAPADAALAKIGGPGKEFWADGRNWPLSPHRRRLPEPMGHWRVEVKPGQPRADDCFLHMIQTSDQTVETMIESRVSETEAQFQLAFSVGPRAYVLALNKSGDVGGHICIAEGDNVLVDRALTQQVMPQEGLALSE